MNTVEFTKSFKLATGLTDIYPNILPDDKTSCTGVFTYGGTADRYLATGKQKLQFLIANIDRQIAESNANSIMMLFRENIMLNQEVESQTILNIDLLQLTPMYVGKDEQSRYRFSFNIEIQIKIHY